VVDKLHPWLADALRTALRDQRSHALLVHGPSGVGQFELAIGLARGWLCEGADAARPCGVCAACKLIDARSHPDLMVLLPEALRPSLGWEIESEGDGDKASKTKPSKDIKVEAVRGAVEFAQTTSARGRGKVVVVHPAERMNTISANTLLKTLEEPPGAARFVLSSGAADALLPTIRSRCLAVALRLPPADEAIEWLRTQGVADAAELLAAAGGQPDEALLWSRDGIGAAWWMALPGAIQRGPMAGVVAAVSAWPLPRLIDALHKLCHDALSVVAGAAPRYFPARAIDVRPAALSALLDWERELTRASRHAEHPWNAGLAIEALIEQGHRALSAGAAARSSKGIDSVHSRA